MRGLSFDIAHMLAGSLVLVSFMQLYQDRLYALLNIYALHALILAMSVAWQAFVQDAPHLYLTAVIALVFGIILAQTRFGRYTYAIGSNEEGVRRAYRPDKLVRLGALKHRYDPENIFHLNHNIRPVPGAAS